MLGTVSELSFQLVDLSGYMFADPDVRSIRLDLKISIQRGQELN